MGLDLKSIEIRNAIEKPTALYGSSGKQMIAVCFVSTRKACYVCYELAS